MRRNNYIEYKSRGNRYENLSPKEYLDIIRSYLTDLINDHKPTVKLNNDDDDEDKDDDDDERGEWKVQLVMQNNCVSVKSFENTSTIYSKSEPVEVSMGSDSNDVIDRLFDTTLEKFQETMVTSRKRRSKLTHESVALMHCYFQKTDIRRAESYIKSPERIANKEATMNPKNEKDNKCFQWSIAASLNYNEIKKYIYLKKI